MRFATFLVRNVRLKLVLSMVLMPQYTLSWSDQGGGESVGVDRYVGLGPVAVYR